MIEDGTECDGVFQALKNLKSLHRRLAGNNGVTFRDLKSQLDVIDKHVRDCKCFVDLDRHAPLAGDALADDTATTFVESGRRALSEVNVPRRSLERIIERCRRIEPNGSVSASDVYGLLVAQHEQLRDVIDETASTNGEKLPRRKKKLQRKAAEAACEKAIDGVVVVLGGHLLAKRDDAAKEAYETMAKIASAYVSDLRA